MGDYLVFILPIGFFLITLVIILTDRKERNIANVKRKVHEAITEIDNRMNVFRNQLTEIEKGLSEQEDRAKALIQTVQSQLREIETYSDDLGRLRVAMKNYEKALDALAVLTEDADEKASQTRANVERLVEFNKKAQEIQSGFEALINQITVSEETMMADIKASNTAAEENARAVFEKMRAEGAQTLEDFKVSADECINNQIEKIDFEMKKSEDAAQDCIKRIESGIRAFDETVQALDNSVMHLLGDMGDKAYNQVQLNAELEKLYLEREKLKTQLDSLGKQIEERKTVNSEMEEVSRLQADRLASIKTNIQQLEAQRKQAETALSEKAEREETVEDSDDSDEETAEESVDDVEDILQKDSEPERKVEYTGEEEEIVFD